MPNEVTIQDQLRPIALGDEVGDLPGLALDACDRIEVLETALAQRDRSIVEIVLRLEGVEKTLDEILAMRAMKERLEAATGREASS